MEVELRDLTKKEANLSILGGDIAVLYIVQDKLLGNSTTEFAGVITRHPLTNDLWMRVVSSKPLKDIVKATDAAISEAAELKKLLVSKIKVNWMEFCPKCEVRLKKNDDGLLSCLKCNYVKENTDKPTKEKPEEVNTEFLVIGCLLYTSDAADE